jgi:Ca-activated chloride channel family protein
MYLPALALLGAFAFLLCAGPTRVVAQDARVAIEPRSSSAPSSSANSANRIAPTFRADGNLVLVPVMVTDTYDRLVTGLEKEHFKLFEDKIEQVVTQFGSDDAPVSVGLVFDCSGSMGNKLEKSRMAVGEFLKGANPEDEFSLVLFSDSANLAVGLTRETEEIRNRLLFTRPQGRTALLDAIYLAMHEMRHARHARKAILIISDGGDNASRYSTRELKKLVREADVQIYAIGILEPIAGRARTLEEMDGPALLDTIAEQTGGRLYEVEDTNELPDIASKIGMALRNQYVLGYTPAKPKNDGKYHRIQVKVIRPKGLPSLRASYRAGYVAPVQ